MTSISGQVCIHLGETKQRQKNPRSYLYEWISLSRRLHPDFWPFFFCRLSSHVSLRLLHVAVPRRAHEKHYAFLTVEHLHSLLICWSRVSVSLLSPLELSGRLSPFILPGIRLCFCVCPPSSLNSIHNWREQHKGQTISVCERMTWYDTMRHDIKQAVKWMPANPNKPTEHRTLTSKTSRSAAFSFVTCFYMYW